LFYISGDFGYDLDSVSEMQRNTDREDGEQHRQMKWRETPTDEMERNTDR
jgi:hypothetical protein